MDEPGDMNATLQDMLTQLEHATRMAQQIPVDPRNDYISSALEEVLSEVSKGVDSLLRQHATMQQLSQPQVTAANASASTASAAAQARAGLPQLPHRHLPSCTRTRRRKVSMVMTQTGSCAAGYATTGREPRATRRLSTSPVLNMWTGPGFRGSTITAGLGNLRGKICYKKGAPCLATNEHMAIRQHQQRAHTWWQYTYGWPTESNL